MIRKKSEIRERVVMHAMGGEGYVKFQDWLLPEEFPGHGRVISKVVIPAGCSIGYHKHEGEFEAYVLVQGKASLNDNGTEYMLEVGDMHLCRNGEAHSIANAGDEDLVLSAVILKDLA